MVQVRPHWSLDRHEFLTETIALFRLFYMENELIKKGVKQGVSLNLKTLGIGNGIIDAALQFPQASYQCCNELTDTLAHDNDGLLVS